MDDKVYHEEFRVKGIGQNTEDNTFPCEMISRVSIPSDKIIGKCSYRNTSTANESCYKADDNVRSMTTDENTTVWDASDRFMDWNMILLLSLLIYPQKFFRKRVWIFLEDKNLDDLYNLDPEDTDNMKVRKKSKTPDYVEDGTAVFVSFDIETGGDDCGIL